MVEPAFTSLVAAAAAGLVLSVIIERLMTPAPRLQRAWGAWSLHCGLWLLVYGLLALLLGRPWFAAAGVSAFLLMLVLVNNAKVKALREPFIFQDYEYFTDAIRHPRLYIPFLGWAKFLLAALGFLMAVAVGLLLEQAPAERFAWAGQLGGIAVVLGVSALLLATGSRFSLPITLQPEHDIVSLGFLASLWRYAEEERKAPVVQSPFDSLNPRADMRELPHLVAVQSESFFDPRTLFAGIRHEILAEFDQLKTQAAAHGKIRVPAWGANTVRTEFAFLSGLDEAMLGVHRFNPYRAIASNWEAPSLAAFLKRLGYRTVCIHPYPASFYQRNIVYPRLGFDEFIDICAFAEAERFGPYVSDAAVAEKMMEILDQAAVPTFVFAITMENHGPLHLEQVNPEDVDSLYVTPPPPGCEDLTVYLRHVRNADHMVGLLRQRLERCKRHAGLCWFGDHVPIMPSVYDEFGFPAGEVDFVIWDNKNSIQTEESVINVCHMPILWLKAMKVLNA